MGDLAFISNYFGTSIEVKSALSEDRASQEMISRLASEIVCAFERGNKVLIAGNGGSAADAQHIAAEFVSRFFFDRPGLPAIALTTDTSMLTAIGNDYGFDLLFARQVQALGRAGDIFVGISTSGNSKNVIEAVKTARDLGLHTTGLCGEGGELKAIADIVISVPSRVTPHIQECHICIGHIICALVEREIFGDGGANV